LVGGSPFYIYSIIQGWQFPKLKPNQELRKKLEKQSAEELFKMLQKIDKRRSKNIEKKNKRRLIRAIEIAKTIGKVPVLREKPLFDCLILGIKKTREELSSLIEKRLLERIEQGMIEEIKKLHEQGVTWKRLDEFGLEYRWISRYLQNKISYLEMIKFLQKDIEKFSKRQMTWFKKDKETKWIKNQKKAEKLIVNFLN